MRYFIGIVLGDSIARFGRLWNHPEEHLRQCAPHRLRRQQANCVLLFKQLPKREPEDCSNRAVKRFVPPVGRYTTDGSTPTETTGTLYSVPIPISVATTIKAIAYGSGLADSPVTSGAYSFASATGTARFQFVDPATEGSWQGSMAPELCTRTADRVKPETQRTIW